MFPPLLQVGEQSKTSSSLLLTSRFYFVGLSVFRDTKRGLVLAALEFIAGGKI